MSKLVLGHVDLEFFREPEFQHISLQELGGFFDGSVDEIYAPLFMNEVHITQFQPTLNLLYAKLSYEGVLTVGGSDIDVINYGYVNRSISLQDFNHIVYRQGLSGGLYSLSFVKDYMVTQLKMKIIMCDIQFGNFIIKAQKI